jgi:hypothetical protein
MDFTSRVVVSSMDVLPYVAVLLLSIVGYVVVKGGQKTAIDSPWFWVFVFSAVGLVGVWAISKKYDDREKRLEARYEARQRIAERRTQQAESPSVGRPEQEQGEPQAGYDATRQVPLQFLAGGLCVVAIGSGIVLWRTVVKTRQE